MTISKEEFSKFASNEYSLLDDQWRIIKRGFIVFAITSIFYLPIIGTIISVISLINIHRKYKLVKSLKEQFQYKQISELYRSNFDYFRNGFCIYALIDLRDKNVIYEIATLLENPKIKEHKPTREALKKAQKVLAVKFNYDSVDDMMRRERMAI
ncbi:MAG: hypothetical protein FK733_19360 [Asgard group archaeon]|nr:hypothetical protein [Asgard group archaeon]